MRRFSAEYLEDTRRGMWESRAALADLDLENRERVLDVGCGTGELTAVLAEESDATVVGVDADRSLLAQASGADGRAVGDATRLPFADDSFDLVVCQALLINLPDPAAAVEEFARVSSDLVAAIEPDNGLVAVGSSVEPEPTLADRARSVYIEGVETDVTIGSRTDEVFREAGLTGVSTERHEHTTVTEPPYSEVDLKRAQRKATGSRLDRQRETLLAGGLSQDEFEDLRREWREMGREIAAQMQAGEYRRTSVIPFYVTVGQVPSA